MSTDVHSLSRRNFLGRSAANAAGLAVGLVGLSAAQAAAEGRLQFGVIGLRRQGLRVALELAELPGAEVAAVCDVDQSMLRRATTQLSEMNGRPRTFGEAEKLIVDPRLHAVIIATPDHSHASLAIAAMRQGKDVYLESPVCHTIAEGAELLQIAAETGRVVQTGLFDRSLPHIVAAIDYVRSGRLGHVPLVKAWTVQRKATASAEAHEVEAPAGVDYAAWLFPGKERPFDPQRFHRGWQGFWDFGSGEIGNGNGLLDLARWGLGVNLPERVHAVGGPAAERQFRTPAMLQATFTFPSAVMTWEHRQWSNHAPEGRSSGVSFYGDRGTLVLDRGGWKVYDTADGARGEGRAEIAPHLQDFVAHIRDRQQPAADLASGVMAATLGHLANISYRVGREIRFDAASGRCVNDEVATALCHGEAPPTDA